LDAHACSIGSARIAVRLTVASAHRQIFSRADFRLCRANALRIRHPALADRRLAEVLAGSALPARESTAGSAGRDSGGGEHFIDCGDVVGALGGRSRWLLRAGRNTQGHSCHEGTDFNSTEHLQSPTLLIRRVAPYRIQRKFSRCCASVNSTAAPAGYGKNVAQEGNKLEIEFEHAGLKKVLDSFVSTS
jgi:hypothetical protein